jgi:DNA-binding protein HU-beta
MTTPTTNVSDLIDRVALTTQQSRTTVKRTVQEFLSDITQSVGRGERVAIRDFGTFVCAERRGGQARNPRTGEAVTVPSRQTPRFRPARALKDIVGRLAPPR